MIKIYIMRKQVLTFVFLCTVAASIFAGHDSCQNQYLREHHQLRESFFQDLWNLNTYVKEGNVSRIAQLTQQAKQLKQPDRILDLDLGKVEYITGIYKDCRKRRDEQAIKVMAPFILGLGWSFVMASTTFYEDEVSDARWAVKVASQIPGAMVTDIQNLNEYEIKRAWPFIPRHVQKGISKEIKGYYKNNCPERDVYNPSETAECADLYEKIQIMRSASGQFKDLCKIIPQELKEQAEAGQLEINESGELKSHELPADNNTGERTTTESAPVSE